MFMQLWSWASNRLKDLRLKTLVLLINARTIYMWINTFVIWTSAFRSSHARKVSKVRTPPDRPQSATVGFGLILAVPPLRKSDQPLHRYLHIRVHSIVCFSNCDLGVLYTNLVHHCSLFTHYFIHHRRLVNTRVAGYRCYCVVSLPRYIA